MRIVKKIFIVAILIFSLLFLSNQINYAVEDAKNTQNSTTSSETNNNNSNTNINANNTQNNNTENNNKTTTNSQPTTSNNVTTDKTDTTNNKTNTTKSSNANLTTLGIKPAQYDFTGFNNNTTYYKTKVPESIETIQVFAKTQDSKAKLEGTGNKTLNIGQNLLEVTVIAEDGTEKVYTIDVTRGEGAIEKEDEEGLKELSVKGATLSPEFSATTYEYTVKYIGEETKLEITTEPAQSDYIVEVIGNNDLQEGENIITILVSDKNGVNVATYQLIVNKSLIDLEAIERQKAEEQENMKKLIIGIIIGIIVGIIIIATIIYMIIKHKKNKNDIKTSIDDSENEDNYEDDYEDDVPKALKNKKNRESEEKKDNNYSNIEEEEDSQQHEKRHKGKRFKR